MWPLDSTKLACSSSRMHSGSRRSDRLETSNSTSSNSRAPAPQLVDLLLVRLHSMELQVQSSAISSQTWRILRLLNTDNTDRMVSQTTYFHRLTSSGRGRLLMD